MKELWKYIEGFEQYQVSNLGNVRRWQRRLKKWYYLKPYLINSGYLVVALRKNNKAHKMLVHRLVAQAFIPNPLNLPYVNHKSEVKTENFVENLEWCSMSYNNTYNNKMKCRKRPVLQIKNGSVIKEWDSITDAGNTLGISISGIANVLCGRAKTSAGFVWEYKKVG